MFTPRRRIIWKKHLQVLNFWHSRTSTDEIGVNIFCSNFIISISFSTSYPCIYKIENKKCSLRDQIMMINRNFRFWGKPILPLTRKLQTLGIGYDELKVACTNKVHKLYQIMHSYLIFGLYHTNRPTNSTSRLTDRQMEITTRYIDQVQIWVLFGTVKTYYVTRKSGIWKNVNMKTTKR